jgi:tRNA 5-methylaminomethyl-2-thiouridine biosynthesis bifunctional protein
MSAVSATTASKPMDWQGRDRFTAFDSEFGDGARFRALLDAWRRDPQRPARLHYLARADGPLPGFRRIAQDDPAVTLDLLYAPLDAALAQLDARLDAIALHAMPGQGSGFARALARLAAPGAVLEAHGLSDTQAHALGGAGFDCGSGADGVIRAVFTSRKPPSPWARTREPQRSAMVLGGGLAGAAACERLSARGWQVTLLERHATLASEASGNLAGIFMPLLSKDDNIMTRLSRAAYLYALDYWAGLGGVGGAIAGARCGVLQLARDAAHAQVQRAIAQAHHYPADFAQWCEAEQASALANAPAPDGGWLFAQAGWARPSSVCNAMLDACGPSLVRHTGVGDIRLERHAGMWHALAADGALVARAPVVIVANGTGALQLAQTAALPLAAVRGQVTHLAAGALPALPRVLCREAYVTPAIDGWHSLGASYDNDADPHLRAASQEANLAKIGSLLGDAALGRNAPLAGRVGFRCVAPDRLPLVGALPEAAGASRIERLRQVPRQPGLYGLLGYASRGLCWAPLVAELLASQLDGDALPLEADLVTALDPARFLLRARRQM